MRWTLDEYDNYLKRSQEIRTADAKPAPPTAAPSKYHSVMTEIQGIKFHSKREATYFQTLQARVHLGDVKYFLRQVPFHLPGGIKYLVDFLEVHADGSVHYIDVKGFKTETYRIKRRQVEALYPVKIEEVK